MSHRYQKLLTPLVLPNGAVLKNRIIQPKCAPDQIQGPGGVAHGAVHPLPPGGRPPGQFPGHPL